MLACADIPVPSAVAKLSKIPHFLRKIPHLKHYPFLTTIHRPAHSNMSSQCPS